MSTKLLEVRELTVGYGKTKVLSGLSIQIRAAEAYAVLGANGAGKSTLMRAVSGLIRPWSGSVVFEGRDVSAVSPEERAMAGIALAPEGRGIFVTLSIEENLRAGATAERRRVGRRNGRRVVAEGLERAYDLFPVLGQRRNDLASKLSGGQQQMLAIARALMAKPRLLLLDEPCLGLAPKIANEVYDALRELRRQGQSLLVVEESTRRALDFADRGCVLRLGVKVLEDDAAELRSSELLVSAYFGGAKDAAAAARGPQ